MTQISKTVSFSMIAVFAVAALIAFSIIGGFFNKAQSQDDGVRGPFTIAPAGDDRLTVWRIDQSSGRVSFCVRDTQSQDPKFIAGRAPFCSAWGN